ncbi:NAD(P)-binding domain-containing protein, partial [Streptomyces sp. NPDC007107]|uniref:NADPH-dependent F420 reductase n=1 Tax=Streptomyces sp. NPDC007107 TaxID=3156915 RepID=UPI0034002A70
MRIGIIGTGNMADALGGRWAAAGHRVLFGGRSPERARALADRTGGSAGTLRDAAGSADAVLLALPYDAVAGVLAELGSFVWIMGCCSADSYGSWVVSRCCPRWRNSWRCGCSSA